MGDARARPLVAPEWAVGLACVALALSSVALANYVQHGRELDFWCFYAEGRAWLDGQPLYAGTFGKLNLNSPALTVLLFAPLALLPYPVTQALWMLACLSALWLSVRLIGRELEMPWSSTLTLGAMLVLTHGAFQTIAVGQLAFVLVYPCTRAWVCYRRGELVTAGAWLAPAIVAKPPLALMALLLAVPTWLTAGVLSAGLSLLTLPLTGMQAWRDWLRIGSGVNWLPDTFNASLWGVVARWQGGDTPVNVSGLEPSLTALVVLTGLGLAILTVRQTDTDRRFLCAGLWSVLLSPLGWAYYVLVVAGPAAALWAGSRLALASYVLLVLPMGMDRGLGPVVGSVFCWGVLGLWVALGVEAQRTSHVETIRPRAAVR